MSARQTTPRGQSTVEAGSAGFLHRIATKKAMLKLVPLMAGAYLISYVDRTNVALAKSALEVDAGISAAAFGLGAGVFFLTYALLEIPSNLALHKVGARAWITRIAVTWGLLSMAMVFVSNETSFYVLRLLLGAAEAGLFPGLMYVITKWFAQEDRAKIVGLLLVAGASAGIIGNPIGGAIMTMDGAFGLHGWQWLFLIEGLPAVLLGLWIWKRFPDSPSAASWLTAEEARVLSERAGDVPENHAKASLRTIMSNRTTALVAVMYFLSSLGVWGAIYFIPAVIGQMGVTDELTIGLLAGLVSVGSLVGVLVFPRLLRRWHSEFPLMAASWVGVLASAVLFLALPTSTGRLVALTILAFFLVGGQPLIWSVAMHRMSGRTAAVALAFVNTVGLLGGFFGPTLFGAIEDVTGKAANGFAIVIVCSLLGLVFTAILSRVVRRSRSAADAQVAEIRAA